MLFFTEKWASGEVSERQFEKAVKDYRRYLDALDSLGAVRRFAESVSLNDAYLDRLTSEGNDLRLLLLTGDNQVGYWRTELSYGNAQIASGENLLRTGLRTRPTEIWYDEFSGHSPLMKHSFLLVGPNHGRGGGEFEIEFETFEYSQTPAAARVLATPQDQSSYRVGTGVSPR